MFGEKKRISPCVLLFFVFLITFHQSQSEKIKYAVENVCDRHSLDAVYQEKYKLVTNNIFADTKEFVSRVADLTADSLTSIMAELPDRDVSDHEEKKVYTQFKALKGSFTSKVKKMQKNITIFWEELITSHSDLMLDNGKSSLEDYRLKTINMTDSYTNARKTLDSLLSSFIGVIKSIVRDGLVGIKMASEEALKDDEKKKKNETEKDTSDEKNLKKKSKEELLQDKMLEISKMIVRGFLGNLTLEVIQRKVDLSKESGVKPENRDSVLDDIEFDLLMVKNRIGAITQTDVPRDKGATDLARRSIYMYWNEQADIMYKDKIKAEKSPSDSTSSGRLYYRNLWKDEEKIAGTLLNLMEVYP